MIRTLQSAGPTLKIILGGMLLVICAGMVITLIPGGIASSFGIGAPPKFIPASELDDLRLAAQAQIEAAREDKDRFQSEYPVKNVIWDYKFKKDKKPFKITAIYHDDKFTYIRSSAQEKPTLYEVKDGKPNLINFDLRDGVYVTPKIIDEGYLTVGKHKTTFKRIAY